MVMKLSQRVIQPLNSRLKPIYAHTTYPMCILYTERERETKCKLTEKYVENYLCKNKDISEALYQHTLRTNTAIPFKFDVL